jgi:hypothetical protein
MDEVKQPSRSNRLLSELSAARLELVRAENQLQNAKQQARVAKQRRKEARKAARRSKKEVKRAKAEFAAADEAFKEAEQRLALAGKPVSTTKKSADPRTSSNTPPAKRMLTSRARGGRKILSETSATVLTAIRAAPGKNKQRSAAKARAGKVVESALVPSDRQEPAAESLTTPGSDSAPSPIAAPAKQEEDQKSTNEASTTPTEAPL